MKTVIVGGVAGGMSGAVHRHKLDTALDRGVVLTGGRTADEFAAGSLPGAVHLPLDELEKLFLTLAWPV